MKRIPLHEEISQCKKVFVFEDSLHQCNYVDNYCHCYKEFSRCCDDCVFQFHFHGVWFHENKMFLLETMKEFDLCFPSLPGFDKISCLIFDTCWGLTANACIRVIETIKTLKHFGFINTHTSSYYRFDAPSLYDAIACSNIVKLELQSAFNCENDLHSLDRIFDKRKNFTMIRIRNGFILDNHDLIDSILSNMGLEDLTLITSTIERMDNFIEKIVMLKHLKYLRYMSSLSLTPLPFEKMKNLRSYELVIHPADNLSGFDRCVVVNSHVLKKFEVTGIGAIVERTNGSIIEGTLRSNCKS